MITCSCILPSYKNPDALLRLIQSINATSKPENVNIIVRINENDDSYRGKIFGPNVYFIIGQPYSGLNEHILYQECIKMSKSPWLFFLKDEFVIEGEGWDEELKTIPTHGLIVQPKDSNLMIVPNRCWEWYGQMAIDKTITVNLKYLLQDEGWKTRILEKLTIQKPILA